MAAAYGRLRAPAPYGRLRAYTAKRASEGELAAAIARNLYRGETSRVEPAGMRSQICARRARRPRESPPRSGTTGFWSSACAGRNDGMTTKLPLERFRDLADLPHAGYESAIVASAPTNCATSRNGRPMSTRSAPRGRTSSNIPTAIADAPTCSRPNSGPISTRRVWCAKPPAFGDRRELHAHAGCRLVCNLPCRARVDS